MFITIKTKTNFAEALEASRKLSPNIEILNGTTLVFDITGSAEKHALETARGLRERFDAVSISRNLATGILLAEYAAFLGKHGIDQQEDESSEKGKLSTSRNPAKNGSFQKARPAKTADRDRVAADPDLNSLPISALTDKLEFLDLMDAWAIHDLGAFSDLPEDEMVARFGPEIVGFRERARGVSYRQPNWNVREDLFVWSTELDGEIETIEPLNFLLSEGISGIFKNLNFAALSTQSIRVRLSGRERSKTYLVRIVFPTTNQKLWLRQIVTKIELDPPDFNIDRVALEARAAKPRVVQNKLYSGTVLEPENLNVLVSKLRKVVKVSEIGIPKLCDSWRAPFCIVGDLDPLVKDVAEDSEEVAVTSSFYYFAEPISANVFFEDGEPKVMTIRGERKTITRSGGPWRMRSEWYESDEIRRDEWDLETEDGLLYRLFVDKNGKAFVDGGYD
ncbi:MAG: hypothetical protein R2684_14615 [Pyrinomonadaceae bacterium]